MADSGSPEETMDRGWAVLPVGEFQGAGAPEDEERRQCGRESSDNTVANLAVPPTNDATRGGLGDSQPNSGANPPRETLSTPVSGGSADPGFGNSPIIDSVHHHPPVSVVSHSSPSVPLGHHLLHDHPYTSMPQVSRSTDVVEFSAPGTCTGIQDSSLPRGWRGSLGQRLWLGTGPVRLPRESRSIFP